VTRSRILLALASLALSSTAFPARAGTISGTLLLDGRPAAAATVTAVPHEEPIEKARREARGEQEPKSLATATAGPDGAFALTVPASPGRDVVFRLRVAAKGAVAAEVAGVFDATENEDLGEVALRRAGPLAGRVTGPGGGPVAGARVTLTAHGRFDAASLLTPVPVEARSGADGAFRFEAAAAEGNELVVEAEGLASARVQGARAGALSRAIALVPGAALEGSVRKRDGRPAGGALVRFESDGLGTRWVETGADGAFRLAGLPRRRGALVVDGGDDGFAEAPATPAPGLPPLALTLAPPAVLEGRTLDVETRKPVARVKLRLATEDGTLSARSGADGRFRVRGLRPGQVQLRADEARYVPWTRNRVAIEKGATRTLDVPLTRGASLSGRVVDEDRRPVAGAKLALSDADESPFALASRERSGDPGARIRSRADGTFSATRLAPGGNQRLSVRHPDFEKGTLGGISLAPGEARTGVVVALRRGLVLAGSVKDPEGNPLAGAELALGPSMAIRSSRGGPRMQMAFGGFSELQPARSGADGRFELRGVPPGDYALTAKAPGRATEVLDPVKLVRDVRPEPVEIVLPPGASIAGSVLRKTGGGAEGYFVSARPSGKLPSGNPLGPDVRPTGPDGAFVLDGLKAGESYDLQLYGGVSFLGPGPTKKGIAAPADGVEWIVEGTGAIEGTTVDAKTNRPIESFEVSFFPDAGGFGGGAFRMGRRAGGRRFGGAGEAIAVEAPDGRFQIDDVPAGKWMVVVEAKGYQAGRAAGIVVEEATITDGVEVRVAPGNVLKGRVTDARTGRGIAEASVFVRDAAGPAVPYMSVVEGLLTDVDGRFEAEGLAPGKVTVSVSHPDYTGRTASAELKEGGGNVEVALERGGSLAGVVLSESRQPVPGADVTLGGGAGGGRRFGGEESAATDASGRFRFEHLAPGRYTLKADVPGQSTEPVETVLVEGQPAADVTLVLAGGATIRGVVSGLPDALRGAVLVNASGPRDFWASARTGSDGRFELTGAPAGTISLRARAGDLIAGSTRSATGSVVIAEGQKEAEAEVVFEGNGTLSGRVTRGGQGVAGARVSLGGGRGGSPAWGVTDESGSYRIEGIESGDYTVTAQGAPGSGGQGVTRRVRVDGDARLDVELPLARLYGLVVDGATKQPLADVRVSAVRDAGEGSRPGGATTDTSGRFFVDDVEEGAYTLTLRRAGYQEAKGSASATEAGGDAGTIEMTRGEGLELRVKDGLYQIPLRQVSVRVKDGSGGAVVSTWVSLDGDGRGEISTLKPGRYTLVVSSGGYAPAILEGIVVPGAPLPVVLTPGGSVEVRPGEASREKGAATLRDALGRPYPYRTSGAEGRVPLPAAGSTVLENVAPGSYTLAVEGIAPKGFTVTEGGRAVVELP